MRVWFVDRIDADGDRDLYVPCINKRVAQELIVKLLAKDEEFAKEHNLYPVGYKYETYPVEVIENAEDLP